MEMRRTLVAHSFALPIGPMKDCPEQYQKHAGAYFANLRPELVRRVTFLTVFAPSVLNSSNGPPPLSPHRTSEHGSMRRQPSGEYVRCSGRARPLLVNHLRQSRISTPRPLLERLELGDSGSLLRAVGEKSGIIRPTSEIIRPTAGPAELSGCMIAPATQRSISLLGEILTFAGAENSDISHIPCSFSTLSDPRRVVIAHEPKGKASRHKQRTGSVPTAKYVVTH